MRSLLTRFWISMSGVGLIVGTLFFAAALTPSLIPRTAVTQGILAGTCFAAGYGFGVFWRWLWSYLQIPEPREGLRRIANKVLAVVCALVALAFLWMTAGWQNSVRLSMGLEPVETARPVIVCVVAMATFALLLLIGRLFGYVLGKAANWFRKFVPIRVANVMAAVLAIFLFWSIATDFLFRSAIGVLDNSFRKLDELMEPERPQPQSPLKAGSPQSLLAWNQLGRAGREFIASGPSAADIAGLAGPGTLEPIRVYVGLGAARTPAQRARLALEEMKRSGAFQRSMLVVITPTGTGWIDPAAIDAVEYLHRGDVASVALQYSYLNSPISLIVQPEYGVEGARALFAEIYRYWTTLPKDARPKFYLHGLSLGALNSEKSAELFEILADPIQGALWSGPPFASRGWRALTDGRVPGSPAWLPQFRDGSFVRFMNQDGLGAGNYAPWGPMRIVYLQYASDPVTFFDFRDLYRPPDWLDEPRGPDVAAAFTWQPVITLLQLGLDMAMATTTPIGYGHVYAPDHYVDAWMQVTDVEGWSDEAIAALKAHLRRTIEAAEQQPDQDESGYDGRGG